MYYDHGYEYFHLILSKSIDRIHSENIHLSRSYIIEDYCFEAGITPDCFRKYLRGKRKPKRYQLLKICLAFDLEYLDIIEVFRAYGYTFSHSRIENYIEEAIRAHITLHKLEEDLMNIYSKNLEEALSPLRIEKKMKKEEKDKKS